MLYVVRLYSVFKHISCHISSTMMSVQLKELINKINQDVNSCGFYFRAVHRRLPGNRQLIIEASLNFSQYHSLELIFNKVLFNNCPSLPWTDHWEIDLLELLDPEMAQVYLPADQLPADGNYQVFALHAGSSGNHQYIVIAESLSLVKQPPSRTRYTGAHMARWIP